ncbi:hypothetical protein SAMN04487895_11628 [Paenibacillus sophorae]|uniref:Uncharacterized protein n=1 Tax=Paenibacillus sophorae TaxID=1333845 RepID=A0A1H8U4I7_9BACL|nr:hypothetical protein [Paenibacillus sophorae]SEO98065.1 hypothetical protein SAMN04487895_11628 [Paenibacillus sophorae]
MDKSVAALVKDVGSQDRNARYDAYMELLSMTNGKVDWAYVVWDDLKADLSHPDNHSRSIAAQL